MVSLSNLRLLGNATVHILHNMIDLHGSILSSAATLVKCVSVTVPASNDFTVAGTIDHLPPFVIHNNTVLGTTDDYAVLDISSSSLFSAVAFQRLLQFWAAHSGSNDMSNASLINVGGVPIDGPVTFNNLAFRQLTFFTPSRPDCGAVTQGSPLVQLRQMRVGILSLTTTACPGTVTVVEDSSLMAASFDGFQHTCQSLVVRRSAERNPEESH